MTPETEELLREVLIEILKFYRRQNEECDHEDLARHLDDIDRRKWGYPSLRQKRGRR